MKRSLQSKGSALITVVLISAGLCVIVGGLIALALQSYRMSKANQGRDIARTIAESELEEIYYEFKAAVAANKNVDVVPSTIAPNFLDYSDSSGNAGIVTTTASYGYPTTIRDTYSPKYRPDSSDPLNTYTTATKWTVKRSLVYNKDDKVQGQIGSSKNKGSNYYLTARVEVIPPQAYADYGVETLRTGRQMVYSVYTVLQKGLFYQGDLEMTPATSFDIKGDIAVNGSIYMAAAAQGTDNPVINIFGNITLTGFFNKDPVSGATTYVEPSPYYQQTANGVTFVAPQFMTSQGSQLTPSTQPINFLGGVDVASVQSGNATLFPTINDVYHALITPPPYLYNDTTNYAASSLGSTNGTQNHVDYGSGTPPSDDATVANVRLYNMASLIVTLDSVGKVSNIEEVMSDGSINITDAATNYGGAVNSTTSTMTDQREGKVITVTGIDVGALGALAGDPNFQGVVYVNQQGASNGNVAIRLYDGAKTPQKAATDSSEAVGFTVATNGAVYIQGDYNSLTPTNTSVILADAVTALSNGWSDAASGTGHPTDRVATADMTINAAILTGSTPTTAANASAPATSGGAQNLVRYLEDWHSGNHTVTLNGSLGRLFDSKYFTGAYRGSNYVAPTRNIIYDTNLATSNPKGAPSVKSFSRGAFFNY
jgi:hypothetical protein